MRTSEFAREVAASMLAGSQFSEAAPVLLDSRTLEFNEGWVFFYQSAAFLKTGDMDEALVGNVPIFVPRDEAAPCFLSYHRPFEESMEAFRLSGDAGASPLAQICLRAGPQGAAPVAAIQAIRKHSSVGLSEAKACVDACQSGTEIVVETSSIASAKALVATLTPLGYVANVVYRS